MIILYIVLGLVIIYLAFTFILVHKFSWMVLKPKVNSYEFQMKEATGLKRFTREYIEQLDIEKFEVESRYGYTLRGIIEENEISRRPENRTRVAILCHGYTSGKITMSGYARRLMNLGFTCVIYDHRNHGETGPVAYTTMGYYEKYDLQTVLDYCYERFGSDIRPITCGESMGCATVLSLFEIDDRPVLTIADCGFSDLKGLFEFMLKETFHVPAIFPILPLANIVLARNGHFLMEQVSPREGVKRAQCPILFCHGDKDTFIPCRMSEEMSKLGSGVRKLYIGHDAGHAHCEVQNPDEYTEVVNSFIKNYYEV